MKDSASESHTGWTTKSLAKAAGVSDAYIRQLLLAQKLKGEKLGRDWIIPEAEAQRYLKSREERQQTEKKAPNRRKKERAQVGIT